MKISLAASLLVLLHEATMPLSALEFDADCVVLEAVRQGSRAALATDALMHSQARSGFVDPKPGDAVPRSNGEAAVWRAATYKDGKLEIPPAEGGDEEPARSRGRRGRGVDYVWLTARSHTERIVLLEAQRHSAVYTGGAWRTGDPYGNTPVPIPVGLKKGRNGFLFAASGRGGSVGAKLREPEKPVFFYRGDLTIPDRVAGDDQSWVGKGAVIVVNATNDWQRDLSIQAGDATTKAGAIPPLGVRKVAFEIKTGASLDSGPDFALRLLEGDRELDVMKEVPVGPPRGPADTRRVTFVSDIDGSVQSYGLTPAKPETPGIASTNPGLVLSLHGAGVEAVGQARCYENKDWVHVVAPNNRRPFGFDWEDWGRLDALEVLAHAEAMLRPDPRRRYLSGHSMGGHGTWQLGVHFPDKFAAIGPSAGWISFWSYAGAMNRSEPDAIEKIFLRAASPSDTLALSANYLHQGVYILHGDADDNVPVQQARTMREHLGKFHPDFAYYEQPGAGHWWGNRCMDWPRMFEFFRHHELPEIANVRKVSFKTASPAVSADCHWLRIEAQVQPLVVSSAEVAFDAANRVFTVKPANVARMSLDIAHIPPGDPIGVEIDGQKLEDISSPAGTHRIWLCRATDGEWSVAGKPSPKSKGPHRMGPFKEAFRHHMMFVHGTAGSEKENAWALAKARFDAEMFWYRGNGSIDLVPDREFDPAAFPGRSVILYGNADTNSAWAKLLGASPIVVTRDAVTFGDERFEGDDLSCLFVFPRPDSALASVGVVSGTGLPGLRATDRLPYFVSGVAYPDYTVMRAEALLHGSKGVVKAGFFDNDWAVGSD